MKGQYGIISLIVTSVITVVIAGIMVYAVFFPVTSSINTNTSVWSVSDNLTSGKFETANTNITRLIGLSQPLDRNANAILVVAHGNTSATGSNFVDVYVNNIKLGDLPANAVGTNVTTIFSNVTQSMLGNGNTATIDLRNTTVYQNDTLDGLILGFYYTYRTNIPASQQSNFNILLLLAGILVIIVTLAAFLMVVRTVQ